MSGNTIPLVLAQGKETTNLLKIFKDYGRSALQELPTLLIALAVFVGFLLAAKLGRNAVLKLSDRITEDKSLQRLFGTVARVMILVVGVFATASVLFPGLRAGDLVGVLGLSSVAIGFAFKDIFQNFLAGVLILAQRPFHIGDQIIVSDFEGTVENIKIRSTLIRTYGGERVIMPNSEIYNSPVTVRTAFDQRRTTFSTGIGYDEDIDKGREVILKALEDCELVADDPAPQVYVSEHADSSVNFNIRYWTPSHSSKVAAAQDQVATAVKYALDQSDIEIPYPYRTLEFFDMTEESAEEPAA